MNPENRYNLRTHGSSHPVEQSTSSADTPSSGSNTTDANTSTRVSGSNTTDASTSTRVSPVMASAPRHQIETFTGINQDPKRWLAWYNRYCAYYKLTRDEDKMADFPFHLTEHARAWYDGVTVPGTFVELAEMFEARFQQTNSMDFMSIKQAPNESVQDYFLRLCKCKPNGLNDEWVKGIAIRGLRDELRTIVMPQNPANLEAARRASLLAEETLSMSASASVAAMQQTNFESVVLDQLAQLKLELDVIRSQQARSARDYDHNRQHYQQPGKGYRHPKDRRPPQDYRQDAGYQQSRHQQANNQYPQQSHNDQRPYQGKRYKGNNGKHFANSSFQSQNQ